MVEFACIDHDRRYFIAIRGSLEEEYTVSRKIWRQVVAEVHIYTHIMDLDIHINLAEDIYYDTFSALDCHN